MIYNISSFKILKVLYLNSGEEQRAEQMRKAKDYSGAKPIFKNLWEEKKNPKNAAQYLHCLRKLKEKKEAVKFAYDLKDLNLNHDWVYMEIFWTLLIFDLKSKTDFNEAKNLSKYLEELLIKNPYKSGDIILANSMVKISLENKKWDNAFYWLDKIDINKIKEEKQYNSEWTNKSNWFYRKAKCLFELGRITECLTVLDEFNFSSLPWSVKKNFLTLKAKVLVESRNFEQALNIYQELTKGKADSWIFQEKGKLLILLDNKDKALLEFYSAASSSRQLNMLVTIFNDIGILCLELKKEEEALVHFVLEKLVREEKGWQIKESLNSQINTLLPSFPQHNELSSVKEAHKICRNIWRNAGISAFELAKKQNKKSSVRKKRLGLIGSITGLNHNKPYCFIKTKENDSFFCLKSEIKDSVSNYDEVTFDAIPSFDKSKNKESWKAVNVEKI